MNATRTLSLLCILLSLGLTYPTFPAKAQSSESPASIERFYVPGGSWGFAFDGENIWVANDYDGTVTKMASDGTIEAVYRAGRYPTNLLFDGKNIWIADSGIDASGTKVTKLLARNGRFMGQFTVDEGPSAMASDGLHIWVTCFKHDTVVELRIKDGSVVNKLELRKGLDYILFDGSSIWVTNSPNDKITKISQPSR